MEQVQDVVIRYMERTGLTLRKFADALALQIREETLSHSAVLRWRDGRSEPDTDFLCRCLLAYRDWRFDFALDCLAAKRPEIWGVPDGGIWPVAHGILSKINGGL